MASNGALAERNERVKYAKSIGVEKPHLLKKDALEAAITVAETTRVREVMEAGTAFQPAWMDKPEDPFDDIDPATEGDALPEPATVAEAVSLRDSIREVWLIDAVAAVKNLFRQAGYPQADTTKVLISTGFPQGNVRKIIGQCHHADSNEGIAHLFINPTQDDTLRVLEIVTHEFNHAMGHKGHTGEFRKAALAVGLKGVGGKAGTGFTSTDINPDHMDVFKSIVDELGPYPHTKVNLAIGGVKKQTTRMLKATCIGKPVEGEDDSDLFDGIETVPCELADESGNGYVIRLTKKWAEVGLPSCPCGGAMQLDDKPEGKE